MVSIFPHFPLKCSLEALKPQRVEMTPLQTKNNLEVQPYNPLPPQLQSPLLPFIDNLHIIICALSITEPLCQQMKAKQLTSNKIAPMEATSAKASNNYAVWFGLETNLIRAHNMLPHQNSPYYCTLPTTSWTTPTTDKKSKQQSLPYRPRDTNI